MNLLVVLNEHVDGVDDDGSELDVVVVRLLVLVLERTHQNDHPIHTFEQMVANTSHVPDKVLYAAQLDDLNKCSSKYVDPLNRSTIVHGPMVD
jgi:hypothetical protein